MFLLSVILMPTHWPNYHLKFLTDGVGEGGGSIAEFLPDLVALDLIPSVPKKIQRKKWLMLLRLINDAA